MLGRMLGCCSGGVLLGGGGGGGGGWGDACRFLSGLPKVNFQEHVQLLSRIATMSTQLEGRPWHEAEMLRAKKGTPQEKG